MRLVRDVRKIRQNRLVTLGVVGLLAAGYLVVTTLGASAATQLLSQGNR